MVRFLTMLSAAVLSAAELAPPAGSEAASRRPGATSNLPGGRQIDPAGRQFTTGPGSSGLAISPNGKYIVVAGGHSSLTVLERQGSSQWRTTVTQSDDESGDAAPVRFHGLAFESNEELYAAEGPTGRVRKLDPSNGKSRASFDLNQQGYRGSFATDLAFDRGRGLLHVLDNANQRLAIFDVRRKALIASLRIGKAPYAIALSADGRHAYVTHWASGRSATKETGNETKPLAIINLNVPVRPFVEAFIGGAGEAAAGVAIRDNYVYVSRPDHDAISVINSQTFQSEGDIPIRIPGLENYRGIAPLGLAVDPGRGWLLVAESGINAIGVVDFVSHRVVGHLPAAWIPERLAISDGVLFSANAKGFGSGPNATPFSRIDNSGGLGLPSGAVIMSTLPGSRDLSQLTRRVMELNGFLPKPSDPPILPPEIRHVVLIVKDGRTFDEIFGDIEERSNGSVRGAPELARYGRRGIPTNIPGQLRQRVQSKSWNVTPNHRALAEQGSISDNFYAAGPLMPLSNETSGIGQHLDRYRVSYRFFEDRGAGATAVPDQHRASRFIDRMRAEPEMPRLTVISLPGDRTGPSRPGDGYPFAASYVADNDVALGRILEFLSSRKEWRQMTVFVTEASTNGLDHIHPARTVLLAAGPYVKKGYLSRTNSDFAGLRKTIFQLLKVPPLNLFDAAAADLSDCFTPSADFSAYQALPVSMELFDPSAVQAGGTR